FDSISYSIPYADSVLYTDTLTVLAASGTFNIVGFAEDSSGRRATSGVVTVVVLSAANDTTPPSVTHTVGTRVELNDAITVHPTPRPPLSLHAPFRSSPAQPHPVRSPPAFACCLAALAVSPPALCAQAPPPRLEPGARVRLDVSSLGRITGTLVAWEPDTLVV